MVLLVPKLKYRQNDVFYDSINILVQMCGIHGNALIAIESHTGTDVLTKNYCNIPIYEWKSNYYIFEV
jgi:hypothetical protein